MKLSLLFACPAIAELYPSGKQQGDMILSMDSSYITKVALNQNAEFFGMKKNALWISNNGVVSIDTLDTIDDEEIVNNLVVAPLWGASYSGDKPASGKVFYRVVSDSEDEAWSEIEADIGSNFQLSSFLIVTFKHVQNLIETDKKNTYQLVFANGTVNGNARNHVLFNYHQMTWIPDDLTVGVFAARKETEQCGRRLKVFSRAEEFEAGSNIGQRGKWLLSFDSDLSCDDHFRTECPEPRSKFS